MSTVTPLGEYFPEPLGAPAESKSNQVSKSTGDRGRGGLECAANPEFPGLEFENQLVGVTIGAKNGGIESRLMLAVALGLRKTCHAGSALTHRNRPELL